MKTLEQLNADAQQASEKAAAARDALDRAQAAARQRRQERLDAHDEAVLKEYDRAELDKDIADAKQRLVDAIKNDNVWSAIIDLGVAERNLHHRYNAAVNGSSRFGIPTAVGPPPGAVSPMSFDVIANIADRIASNLVEDDLDRRAADRETAGDMTT